MNCKRCATRSRPGFRHVRVQRLPVRALERRLSSTQGARSQAGPNPRKPSMVIPSTSRTPRRPRVDSRCQRRPAPGALDRNRSARPMREQRPSVDGLGLLSAWTPRGDPLRRAMRVGRVVVPPPCLHLVQRVVSVEQLVLVEAQPRERCVEALRATDLDRLAARMKCSGTPRVGSGVRMRVTDVRSSPKSSLRRCPNSTPPRRFRWAIRGSSP